MQKYWSVILCLTLTACASTPISQSTQLPDSPSFESAIPLSSPTPTSPLSSPTAVSTPASAPISTPTPAPPVPSLNPTPSPSSLVPASPISAPEQTGCSLPSNPLNQPALLLQTDFSQEKDPSFGNDTQNAALWRQFGGDYAPSAEGVSLWNPQDGSISETGLIKTLSLQENNALRYQTGDALLLKVTVLPNFQADTSQASLALRFNDPSESVIQGPLLQGPLAKAHTFYLQADIPPCATEVSLNLLGNLAPNESASLTFSEASLELIPQAAYEKQSLLEIQFDQAADNAFGPSSPAEVDEEFGYDAYVLADPNPEYPEDRALTVVNPGEGSDTFGGVIKTVNLETYPANSRIQAQLFSATTFIDKASEASFYLEFFDAQNNKLSQANSSTMSGNHHFTLMIDTPVPTGAQTLKAIPVLKFGPNETSSLLWDDLKLTLLKARF